MEQLAIFGGKPVREKKIFYGRQYIDQADVEAVTKVLTADVITSGPKVSELEQHLCELTHAKYAVVVCNGTAALHLAALAAGFGEGDEVIVSSITFAASSNCVLYAGAKPVFADIDPETYNIEPASIRKLITPSTKAIVAVPSSDAAAYPRYYEGPGRNGTSYRCAVVQRAGRAGLQLSYDGFPGGTAIEPAEEAPCI